jgi:hypothetical protein
MKLQIPAINIKPIIMSLLKLFISYDPVIKFRDLYAALLLFYKFCCVVTWLLLYRDIFWIQYAK